MPPLLNSSSHISPNIPLPISNFSSLIQCITTTANDVNNSNDFSDAIISARIQENDTILTDYNNRHITTLPDYSSEADNGVHSSSACKNNGSIIRILDGIVGGRSNAECDEHKSRKGRLIDISKIQNDCKKRKTNPVLPVSQPTNLAASVHTSTKHVSENSSEKPRNIPRPPYSYVALIRQAILSSPEQRVTLQEIYAYVTTNFEYYVHCKPTWKNSIRHNLSLNNCFYREPREGGGEKKGGYWLFHREFDNMFQNNNFRRRVRMKRPSKVPGKIENSTPPTLAAPNNLYRLPHTYYNTSHDFLRAHPSERNWSSLSSYASCQYMPTKALHGGGYRQSPPIVTTSAQTPIPFPAAHNYVPSSAFPDHYPSHYLHESSCSAQQNRRSTY